MSGYSTWYVNAYLEVDGRYWLGVGQRTRQEADAAASYQRDIYRCRRLYRIKVRLKENRT